jgi:hypothetical protein
MILLEVKHFFKKFWSCSYMVTRGKILESTGRRVPQVGVQEKVSSLSIYSDNSCCQYVSPLQVTIHDTVWVINWLYGQNMHHHVSKSRKTSILEAVVICTRLLWPNRNPLTTTDMVTWPTSVCMSINCHSWEANSHSASQERNGYMEAKYKLYILMQSMPRKKFLYCEQLMRK